MSFDSGGKEIQSSRVNCVVCWIFFFFGALHLMYQKWLLRSTHFRAIWEPLVWDYPVSSTHMSQYNIDSRFVCPAGF